MKKIVKYFVPVGTLLHCILVYFSLQSWEAGICGCMMQVLYHRFLYDFPSIKLTSPPFLLVCGKLKLMAEANLCLIELYVPLQLEYYSTKSSGWSNHLESMPLMTNRVSVYIRR
jgi:hypothetical protein